MQLVLLHVFGFAGGLLARRLKIPAGGLIGSLLAVLLFNTISGAYPEYPLEFRVVIQMFAGLVIGCRFTRSDIRNLKLMLKPVVLLVLLLLLINLLFAFLMAQVSNVSLMTAFFACAPGGVSDLALVAADFGAEMEQVALLQLFRLVFVVIVFPPIMKKMFPTHATHAMHAMHIGPAMHSSADVSSSVGQIPSKSKSGRLMWMVVSSMVAIAGGYVFNHINFPAGAIVGAIFSIILLNLVTDKAAYPSYLKTAVQLLAGCYIGSKMTSQFLSEIPTLAIPLVVLILELFFMAFVTAYIIHKLTKLNFATALFSSTPGGITEMSIISEEMGLDTPKIVLMHTCRIIAVLSILPSLVRILNFH